MQQATAAVQYSRPYGFGPIGLDGLPESVNWNLVGAVTEVPDQKKLGSCWAFATTGSIESLDYITTGNLVKYSAQQLIDCNRLTNHYGCSVGYVEQTFDYIMSTEGIVRSDLYHTGKRGACKPLMGEGVTVHGLGRVKPDSEYALKCAVAQQPVIVLINAHSEAFQNYKGGILYGDGAEMRELNHFVLCVGYDVSIDGDMFWILRNSWGEWWGIGGYVLIARETQKLAQSGGCFGIARKGLFPIGTSRKMVSVKCEKAIVSHISY